MKNIPFFVFLFSLILPPFSYAADRAETRHFQASGEVISVDPLYSRITISHSPIKGFSGDGETEFTVKTADLLKKISKSDLVDFEIEETKSEANIIKITKTGQAPPKEEGVPVGRAAQEVLEGAGTIVKTVASPIAPVGEVANATADATTNATGSVLTEAKPAISDGDAQVKRKF